MTNLKAHSIGPLEATKITLEFAEGKNQVKPGPRTIALAARLIDNTIERAIQPNLSITTDGTLSFDLHTQDDKRVQAKLSVNGHLDIYVQVSSTNLLQNITHHSNASETQFKEILN